MLNDRIEFEGTRNSRERERETDRKTEKVIQVVRNKIK